MRPRQTFRPATRLNLPETLRGSFGNGYERHGVQGGMDLFTWFARPGRLDLRATGGLIAHYRDRGHVKIALHSPREETLEPVATDESVPPDGEERSVSLETPHDGLHRLELRDGGDASRLLWPDAWPMTVECSPDARRLPLRGPWTLVFYVPRGTPTLAGFTDSGHGKILDSTGRTALSFGDLAVPGYFAVPVPAGTDGTLWRIENHTSRRFMLLTVPPYLARNERELLLPREVVEADRRKP